MTKSRHHLTAEAAVRDKPFSISVERRPQAAIVRLRGACTMEVSAQIGERLVALASEPVGVLVLDMSALDFIESTGLGGIVAGYVRARRHRSEVRMVAPPQAIQELLELTRLTQLFRVFPTIDDALAASPI
jgi:anti-sigma B factor antagonist